MNKQDNYFVAAQSWADDRLAGERRMRRLAWSITCVSTALSLILALALVTLLPLKTVQPYVVTVDRQTGEVQLATTLTRARLSENEAIIQAQLANYVRVRETFDPTDLQANYRRVQLMSAPDVGRAYVASMAASNPLSPLRRMASGETLAIRIKSVSLLGSGSALVRFDADRTQPNGLKTTTPYISALSFGFSDRPLREADRFDNPLGFQVIRYRRDAEGVAQ